jgi:hypothetical protein
MPDPIDPNNANNRAAETTSWLTISLIAIFGVGLLAAIIFDAPIIGRLGDPAFTRGLITWIISMSTIGIAFVLIYQAFFAVDSSDDRFRRAREIFTGLMGVLGTIVGFYFGSAEKSGLTFEVAEIRFADKQLMTHISGGARPYRYSITSTDKNFPPIKKISEDGWIIETQEQTPKPGTTITIEATDSKDQKASRKLDIPGDTKPPTTTPTPKPQATPPTATPPTSASPTSPQSRATPPANSTPETPR